MSSTENSALKKDRSLMPMTLFLGLIALILAVLSSLPKFRNVMMSQVQERKILSKANTTFNGIDYVIFKIRTESGVDIEVYEKDPQTFHQKLKQSFNLNDDKDAFLSTKDRALNLAITDVDKNGTPDIVAPTVDRNGNSRLNIFKFDSDLNQFVPSVQTEN